MHPAHLHHDLLRQPYAPNLLGRLQLIKRVEHLQLPEIQISQSLDMLDRALMHPRHLTRLRERREPSSKLAISSD
jgi:hypothetical protein